MPIASADRKKISSGDRTNGPEHAFCPACFIRCPYRPLLITPHYKPRPFFKSLCAGMAW